jgi:spore coat polysaccharide biosynthesis protein SpsF (cytidylyltransferase family)
MIQILPFALNMKPISISSARTKSSALKSKVMIPIFSPILSTLLYIIFSGYTM